MTRLSLNILAIPISALKEYNKAFPYYEKSIQLEKDVKKKKIVEEKLKMIKEPRK